MLRQPTQLKFPRPFSDHLLLPTINKPRHFLYSPSVHRHFFVTQLSHLFCARVRQEYDDSVGKESDRLSVEQVRGAMNTWLSAADFKPAARRESYEEDLKKQRYYQRRNSKARKSHTKTRIARLQTLGIDVDKIKSCIT